MPVISRFYGIIIKMYFQQKEHNPPHFHAIYGESNKACSLVLEWAKNNQDELLNIWNTQNFKQLEPLE